MIKEKKSKSKYKHDYGLTHVYKFYKSKYENIIDYKKFTTIINAFNNKVIQKLYEGEYISLPYSLGDLFIYKFKPRLKFDENGEVIAKRGVIDYKATKELWKEYPELAHVKRVCYDNFHTDKYKFSIRWKRYHTVRVHKLYNFIPARAFKRNLAAYLREHPNQNYYDR